MEILVFLAFPPLRAKNLREFCGEVLDFLAFSLPRAKDFWKSYGGILAFLAFSLPHAKDSWKSYGEILAFLAFSLTRSNDFREAYGEILAFLAFSLTRSKNSWKSYGGILVFLAFFLPRAKKQEGPALFASLQNGPALIEVPIAGFAPASFVLSSSPSQLPKRHSGGSRHVQGVYPFCHGDLDSVVAGSDGFRQEAVAFRAEEDGKLLLCHEGRVVDAHGVVPQRHGGGFEAEAFQEGDIAVQLERSVLQEAGSVLSRRCRLCSFLLPS